MARRGARNVTKIRGKGTVDYLRPVLVVECGSPGCRHIWKEEFEAVATLPELICPRCNAEIPEHIKRRLPVFKYCRVCEVLQPLEAFHRHGGEPGRRTGRQLECAHCKNTAINPALNPLRTTDQFRESAEGRRLRETLANEVRIDTASIRARFRNRCFSCDRALSADQVRIDHTLPIRLFWPLGTGPTLLCARCNGNKGQLWPSEFYRDPAKLRRLALLTGIDYPLLAGPPTLNPRAVETILSNVDRFMARWIGSLNVIRNTRRLLIDHGQPDIYELATHVPAALRT